jgi:hypothetical protein
MDVRDWKSEKQNSSIQQVYGMAYNDPEQTANKSESK